MRKAFFVYILMNKNKTMYIGVTNDLRRRMFEHKKGLLEGFTKKYKIDRLVYFEEFQYINDAIRREKVIKGWKRNRKLELIRTFNENYDDLVLSLV